jgi:hypothetical protein
VEGQRHLPREAVRSRTPAEEERDWDHGLGISVVFTTLKPTFEALREAGKLAHSLGARITLVVPQVVPYPLRLEDPPVRAQFIENRFRAMTNECGVEASIRIYLCRNPLETLLTVLRPGAIVVLGGPRRRRLLPWWPTKEERLGARIRLNGCEVLFTRRACL